MSAEQKRPQWYQKDVQDINADAQRLLEDYNGLAPREVLPHVLSLRDDVFDVYHYASIGQMRFLSFNLSHMPFWPRVLEKLCTDSSSTFLDVGCCFGQEIRFLTEQGIPSNQLFGSDLERVFIDLGYRLFRDEDRIKAMFAAGDLCADEVHFHDREIIQELHGGIDCVFASSLFRMWDWNTQVKVATRLLSLCRQRLGVIITGRQLGSVEGDHYSMAGMKEGAQAVHYRHDPETMERFWNAIGEATQTSWKVEAGLNLAEELNQTKNMPWADNKIRMIRWCATRQECHC